MMQALAGGRAEVEDKHHHKQRMGFRTMAGNPCLRPSYDTVWETRYQFCGCFYKPTFRRLPQIRYSEPQHFL